jgi:F0F1-type ATP synthase alpha subunit
LERSTEFLEKSSDLAKRASADVRGDLVSFERDAAIAKTAAAMSNTPQTIIKNSAATAELLQQLSFSQRATASGLSCEARAAAAPTAR